jgi:hypothetical protein
VRGRGFEARDDVFAALGGLVGVDFVEAELEARAEEFGARPFGLRGR